MEAEIRAIQPQAKKCLEPSEAGRDKKNYFIETSEGVQPCQQLDFGLVAFRTLREYISVGGFFDPGFVVICYGNPRKQKKFSEQNYEGPTWLSLEWCLLERWRLRKENNERIRFQRKVRMMHQEWRNKSI